jgi:hypothetical protein
MESEFPMVYEFLVLLFFMILLFVGTLVWKLYDDRRSALKGLTKLPKARAGTW